MIRSLLRLALLAAAPAAAQPSLDAFTRPDEVTAVAISPNGTALAAGLQFADGSRVAYLRLPDLRKEATLETGESVAVAQIEWVTRSRFVYTLSAGEPRTEPPPRGEAFALGVLKDERTEFQAFDFVGRNGYVSAYIVRSLSDERVLVLEHTWKRTPFGAWRLDSTAPPTVAIIDAKTERRTAVERLPLRDASVLADEFGRVRFVRGIDAENARVTWWKHDSTWMPLETPGLRPESVTPRLYSAGRQELIFTAAPVGGSLVGLYRQHLDDGEIAPLYVHPRVDVADVVFDPDHTRVAGVLVEEGRPEFHWLDPHDPTAKLYQLLERAFPGSVPSVTSSTADGALMTVRVASDIDPGAWYRVDATSRNADFLFAARRWTDPAQMHPMEPVTIDARDGKTLHAYVTRPSTTAGPFPLIVMPHDDPFRARDRWGFDWRVQLLAAYGYAVLQVNYRGTPGYGLDFVAAGYGEWGAKMQDDITDATLWAIEQRLAAEGNVCIYGSGYGGYAALMGGIREPQLYRCIATYGAITDLELFVEESTANGAGTWQLATLGSPAHGPNRDLRSLLVGGGGPSPGAALGSPPRTALQARSPDYNAAHIEAPVLLIHDEMDPIVGFTHAVRMNQAMRGASKRVVLETTRRGDHALQQPAHRDEVYARLLDFFARNLER